MLHCPVGHGPMQQLPGWFALQGVEPQASQGLLSLLPHPVVQPNGQMLPLRVWRCGVCKTVQLVEDDV